MFGKELYPALEFFSFAKFQDFDFGLWVRGRDDFEIMWQFIVIGWSRRAKFDFFDGDAAVLAR